MLEDAGQSATPLDGDDALSILQELERNTTDEIRRQRAHFRMTTKAGVTLQPGNASDLLSFKVKGMCGDISEGGCCILFPIPVGVGDIYRLQFDRAALDLPLTFARCVRSRLVREDAFEAGFSFFTPVCLPATLAAGSAAAPST